MVEIRKKSELGYPNAPTPRGTLLILILEKDPKYSLRIVGEIKIADFYELGMAKEYANILEKKKEEKPIPKFWKIEEMGGLRLSCVMDLVFKEEPMTDDNKKQLTELLEKKGGY